MGIGFHLDDVEEAYFSDKLWYEMPRESKIYQNDIFKLAMNSSNISKIKIPSGQKITYEANDEGIVKVTETFDQDGESMYVDKKTIISKEIFVAAYEKYIKDGER